MGIWEIVVGAFVLVLSIVMIILIILQEGHQAGLGAVTGGADSFLSRGKARTADAIFAKITKYCAIVFFLLVVALNAIAFFGGSNTKSTAADEATINASSQVSAEASKEASKETSAEASKEASAEASKEASAEASKEASTEASAEASTEESTEASAEESTESTDESSTEAAE